MTACVLQKTMFTNFTFMWPCIVANFLFNKTNRRNNFPKFIFVKKLYLFRAVLLSIIRSFPPYIRHWYMSYSFDDSYQALPGWSWLIAVIKPPPPHHHHLPPWIRSLDLFRHRRVAIVSWGVHDLFFLEVCTWGRVSEIWLCPFFQDGCFSFVCIWISRLVFQESLVLFLWLRFLFWSS